MRKTSGLAFALMLINLLGTAQTAFADRTVVFHRSEADLQNCIARYQKALDIGSPLEADRVCANYNDQNLDCAVSVMREYRVKEHRPAIQVCIMRYTDGAARRCAIDRLEAAKRAGEIPDLGTIIDECKRGITGARRMTQPA